MKRCHLSVDGPTALLEVNDSPFAGKKVLSPAMLKGVWRKNAAQRCLRVEYDTKFKVSVGDCTCQF